MCMRYLPVLIVSLFCVSCGMLGPEDSEAIRAMVEELHAMDRISDSHYQAIIEMLEAPTIDWDIVLAMLGTLAANFLGIRLWRGGINTRKGSVPPA